MESVDHFLVSFFVLRYSKLVRSSRYLTNSSSSRRLVSENRLLISQTSHQFFIYHFAFIIAHFTLILTFSFTSHVNVGSVSFIFFHQSSSHCFFLRAGTVVKHVTM